MTLYMFVGSCNQPTPYFANANGEGLSVFAFDPDTGAATLAANYPGIDNPTFLSVTPDARRIYANSEKFGHAQGLVTALSFDPISATLNHLDMAPSRGSITSHNSFSADGRFLLATNYADGSDGPDQSVAVFPITERPAISPACCSVAHAGRGPNDERQERSHAHFVHQLPSGVVAVADLGLDQVLFYDLEEHGQLSHKQSVDLSPETGPRHLAWTRDGAFLFVVGELSSTVSSLSIKDPDNIRTIDTHSTVAATPIGNHCSDIQVSTDDRHLYVGNRGDDTLASFEILANGGLSRIGITSCGGVTPRALALSPCGNWLLSANQDSDLIAIFALDKETGHPELAGSVNVGTPMCIKFAEA